MRTRITTLVLAVLLAGTGSTAAATAVHAVETASAPAKACKHAPAKPGKKACKTKKAGPGRGPATQPGDSWQTLPLPPQPAPTGPGSPAAPAADARPSMDAVNAVTASLQQKREDLAQLDSELDTLTRQGRGGLSWTEYASVLNRKATEHHQLSEQIKALSAALATLGVKAP